jgi:hypothetical protein
VRCSVMSSFSVLALAACALPAAAPASEMRVLVKLVQPLDDPVRIAEQAASASGSPVRYIASSGGGWHALTLGCTVTADCDAAFVRLQADALRFESVQRDTRKRVVTP